MHARLHGVERAFAVLVGFVVLFSFDLRNLFDKEETSFSLATPACALELDRVVPELLKKTNEDERKSITKKILSDRKILKYILEKPRGAFNLNKIRDIYPDESVNLRKMTLNEVDLTEIILKDAKIYWSKLRRCDLGTRIKKAPIFIMATVKTRCSTGPI